MPPPPLLRPSPALPSLITTHDRLVCARNKHGKVRRVLEILADSCVCALLVGSGSLEAVAFPVNGLPQYTFHTVPGDVDKQFRTSLAWT